MIGTIVALAYRPGEWQPMMLTDSLTASADEGIIEDYGKRRSRDITFLSAQQWREVESELGTSLPWHLRRANVLMESGSLEPLIGRTILIGSVMIQIKKETAPCVIMDRQHNGLKQALNEECRGGVYGRVLSDGVVRVGDVVRFANSQ